MSSPLGALWLVGEAKLSDERDCKGFTVMAAASLINSLVKSLTVDKFIQSCSIQSSKKPGDSG